MRLLRDIEKFHKEASRFLPAAALSTALFLPPSTKSPGAGWDTLKPSEPGSGSADAEPVDNHSDDEDEDPLPQSNLESHAASSAENQPRTVGESSSATTAPNATSTPRKSTGPVQPSERITIGLPSNLGPALCAMHGLQDLVVKERRLRVGQMNDALHAVRVGVAYKSFLYRSSVRRATSYRARLRSFDEVHNSNQDTLAHARLYMCARTSLMSLYDDSIPADAKLKEEMLAKYRVLEKSDLKANTTLIEHDVRGVSHKHLPWFWSLDVNMETKGSAWMAECE